MKIKTCLAGVFFLLCLLPIAQGDDFLDMELEYQILISDAWKWQDGLQAPPFRYRWEAPKYGVSRGIVFSEGGKTYIRKDFSGVRVGTELTYKTSSAISETWLEKGNCWEYRQRSCLVGKFGDDIRESSSHWPALPFLWCSYSDEFLPIYILLRPKIGGWNHSAAVTSDDKKINVVRKYQDETMESLIELTFEKETLLPISYNRDFKNSETQVASSGTFKWERFGAKVLLTESIQKEGSTVIFDLKCEPLTDEEVAKYRRINFQDFWARLPKGIRIVDSTKGESVVEKGFIGTEDDYRRRLVIEQAELQREIKAGPKW